MDLPANLTQKLCPWGFAILLTASRLALQATVSQADRGFIIPVPFPFSIICLEFTLRNLTLKGFCGGVAAGSLGVPQSPMA
jgi:hypothetical protein